MQRLVARWRRLTPFAVPKPPIGGGKAYLFLTDAIMNFRQQYTDPDRDEAMGLLDAIDFSDAEDLTLQQYKEDADINTILRRFSLTGELGGTAREPLTGDLTLVTDYQEALNILRDAKDQFHRLPAVVRRDLDNDPGRLAGWLDDPANLDKARELGLINPEVRPVEPIAVRVLQEDPAPE